VKKLLPLLLSAALLTPAIASAAGFEGKVSMKITSPEGQSQQLDLRVKDTLARMEMPGGPAGGGATIMDFAKHQMIVLMPQQRGYMVQMLLEPHALAPATAGASAAAQRPEPVLEKSGTTEKILGYDCVKYVANDNGATTEIWVTDKLGTFNLLDVAGGGGPMGPGMMRGAPRGPRGGGTGAAAQDWGRLLQGKDMFPLRVVSTAADGKVSRFEVVAIEKSAQPGADFAPPADYHDMSEMIKGMGFPGGMRPPGGG
jgi:hypothetical protein